MSALVLAVSMTASCGSVVILDGIDDPGAGGSASDGRGAGSVGNATATTSGSGVGGIGGTGTGTTTSSSGGTAATCASYCKDIQANCTGVNKQYGDEATCLKACAVLPQGAVADMLGNSVACRAYHGAAPSKASPEIHCSHAGITGGDKDPAVTTDMGPCGPGCDAFCMLALKTCPTIWADVAQCKADCTKFKPSSKPFSTLETVGDTFNCRAYHLLVATQTPMPHCAHIKLDSAASPCK